MKYKFFAIPARNPVAAEDELNAFCSSYRVTFIDKFLVEDGADSFWSVCVSWLDGPVAPSAAASAADSRNKPAIDYKEVVSANHGIIGDNNGFRLARSSTRRWNGRERPDPHPVWVVLSPGEMQGRRMR